MKAIDYSKNIQLHIKVQNKPKEWRLGQAYFNYAEELYPEETNQLRGTEYDCFYNDEKIPEFLEKLNGKLLEFDGCTIIGGPHQHMNTIEFEGKTLEFFGKGDEQFVNDKIRELRKKRNEMQDKIYELSRQLNQLEKECNSTQDEIDNEFLKQEHACNLVGKYIQCDNKIYFVTGVERLFDGVKIISNWYCNPKDKLFYTENGKGESLKVISFENLNAILSGKDKNFKFISREKALEIMNQVIKEKQ